MIDKAFDGVLDVYERLGSEMPRLYEYTRLFAALPESVYSLVLVYEDVLTYHRLAYRLYSVRSSCETTLGRETIGKGTNGLVCPI